MLPTIERTLAPGIILRAVRTDKFKTSVLGVTFLEPLREETASLNALVPGVLRRGTAARPDMEALSAALDDLYGGGIEPVIRKKGEVQCVGFWGSFLDDAYVPEGARILEPAAALLGEIVLSPAGQGGFLPEYVEGEKANLVDRIRAEINDKLQYARSRLREVMCGGEAYGVGKLGSEASARAVTGDALYARYREMLGSAPVYLYYCGSAGIERVERAFAEAFAGLPRGGRSGIPDTVPQPLPAGGLRRVSEEMDVTQGKLVLGFRTGGGFRELDEVACAVLFNAVYGGSANSKLFLNVREKLSLCYFASSALALSKGILLVYSGVDPGNLQRAEDEILAQLRACQRGEIPEEDLEAARRSAVSNFRAALDSQGRLEEYWLNRFVTGTRFGPEELAGALKGVTREQIAALAGRIRPDSIFTLRGKAV